MRASTAWLLARPTAPADRTRFGLVAGTTAVAGGLLLAGERIARLGIDSDRARTSIPGSGQVVHDGAGDTGGLAPYVAQAGLRPGVVVGAALMAVPVLALAVQALRLGSVARERRLAGLRLAGATPSDARRVAAWEAGAAAAVGGLLAGPAYLALWLLLGVLPPAGERLVPDPSWLDLPSWLLGIAIAVVAGAISGALVQGRVLVDPLGVRTRAAHPPSRRGRLVALAGVLLVVIGVVGMRQDAAAHWAVVLGAALLGLLTAAFAAAPALVARRGGRLACGRGVANLLAGRRLAADPRTTGRVCAVLVLCGVALGVEAVMVWDLVVVQGGQHLGDDLSFYLTGYAFATVGVLVATVVAAATLVVGVADQLTDARRPLAALRALGADERVLRTALRRQQTATAGPAAVVGVVAGGLGISTLTGDPVAAVPATVLAAVVVGLAVSGTTRLAVRMLRDRLRTATDPENLRVA